MKTNYISLILFLILTPSIGYSSDKNNTYAIEGAGIASCSKFIETANTKDKHYYIYGGWVEGYLTATNQYQEETFDLTPWQSTQLILKIIESICLNNPKAKFHQVLNNLVPELSKQRIDIGGKFIDINGKRKYIFQEEVILRMKKALTQKQLFSGDYSTEYNDELINAVIKFQKKINQKATGLPDQTTLFELFKP